MPTPTLRPLVAAFLAASMALSAPGLVAQERFVDRKAEGWFFYNEQWHEEPEEEELAPEPPPTPTTTTTTTPPPQPQAPPAATPPAPLSAAWLRENIPKYLDAAFDDPTVENVQTFLYLQRLAMDRSSEFAEVAQLARLGNPWLDETARRPIAPYAAQDLDRHAGEARRELLAELSERVGVFFFYSSDCQLCRTMSPILNMLESQFVTTPISLDGKDLPGNPFPNMRPDNGHAEVLGVEMLPAIYLASPDGQFVPIAQGAISLQDAQERVILGALQEGWITPQQYQRTRAVNNTDMNLARVVTPSQIDPTLMIDEDGFIPPELLYQHLNRANRGNAR